METIRLTFGESFWGEHFRLKFISHLWKPQARRLECTPDDKAISFKLITCERVTDQYGFEPITVMFNDAEHVFSHLAVCFRLLCSLLTGCGLFLPDALRQTLRLVTAIDWISNLESKSATQTASLRSGWPNWKYHWLSLIGFDFSRLQATFFSNKTAPFFLFHFFIRFWSRRTTSRKASFGAWRCDWRFSKKRIVSLVSGVFAWKPRNELSICLTWFSK